MNGKLEKLNSKHQRRVGERDIIIRGIDESKKKLSLLKKQADRAEEARLIIQHVAQQTQEQLEYRVSELVSLALYAVFDNPYSLKLDFVIKRNKTEVDIWFEKGKDRFHPRSASGGGPVDVAAFGLRIALLSLVTPRPRQTLIIDEPFRFLSRKGNLRQKASQMLKEISSKLGLQIIMISHDEDLIEGADKVFEVEQKRKISTVREIG